MENDEVTLYRLFFYMKNFRRTLRLKYLQKKEQLENELRRSFYQTWVIFRNVNNIITKITYSELNLKFNLEIDAWYWNWSSNLKLRLDIKIQWNLLLVNIIYSGHLFTTDTFLRNGMNEGQTLITRPLCRGHIKVNTSP